jgi:predicted XRE-type DNA-binding protein
VVDVEGVGATQAKTLDKVDHMARALVADMLDEPYESVHVAVMIDLPDDVSHRIETMNSTAERAAALNREAAELQYALVAELRQQALTGREIAVILKVTPGRVSQIESSHTSRARVGKTRTSRSGRGVRQGA